MLHPKTIEMSRLYYDEGWTMEQIANHFNVYSSTVCTAIRRMDKRQCPIGTLCKNCKMSECIIKPEYQHIINHGEQRNKPHASFETEFCIICGKTCRNKYYAETVERNGNPQKVYFHKSCYYRKTIGTHENNK